MGYLRGLVHGTVAGAVLGVCVAPQSGRRTREQLAAFGQAAKESYELAGRTIQRAAPLYNAASQMARNRIQQMRAEDQQTPTLTHHNGHPQR